MAFVEVEPFVVDKKRVIHQQQVKVNCGAAFENQLEVLGTLIQCQGCI